MGQLMPPVCVTQRVDAFSSLSHRYDSLTGVPSCQRTLAFEKGSVLFNIGALYTQIGARQDRSATAGIDKAIDAFQRAAGTETTHAYLNAPQASTVSLFTLSAKIQFALFFCV